MRRPTTVMVSLLSLVIVVAGCGAPPPPDGSQQHSGASPAVPAAEGAASATPPVSAPPSPLPASTAPTTNLDDTPLSAADYAMYAAIMGGASAMLAALGPDDRAALDTERRVHPGSASRSADTDRLLARARDLHRSDEQLARLQGVEARYLVVKAKVEAVIGPRAHPASDDDRVAAENRRFLEAHRSNIERLQRILRDPLARPTAPVSP